MAEKECRFYGTDEAFPHLVTCNAVPESKGHNVTFSVYVWLRSPMRVDGDVLEVFWSYGSEVSFVKVPCNNKRRNWVRGFLLTYIPIQFLECLVCVGLRGNVNSCDYDRFKFPR